MDGSSIIVTLKPEVIGGVLLKKDSLHLKLSGKKRVEFRFDSDISVRHRLHEAASEIARHPQVVGLTPRKRNHPIATIGAKRTIGQRIFFAPNSAKSGRVELVRYSCWLW